MRYYSEVKQLTLIEKDCTVTVKVGGVKIGEFCASENMFRKERGETE